jgi:hypothetical protein
MQRRLRPRALMNNPFVPFTKQMEIDTVPGYEETPLAFGAGNGHRTPVPAR